NHQVISYILVYLDDLTTLISKEFFISDVYFYIAMLEKHN
ncbi:alpha-E domain-containing protein, partial [Francisella tularensis subsp. holarctica]|nr:alpha-E domain-containing protein [Francisella tularensis subsp. holarctica]